MENFTCVSINHRLCDEAFRSLFTFGESECKKLLFSVRESSPVLVCTCNRTELYFFGGAESGIELLSEAGGIPREQLKQKVMIFSGEGAAKHLFNVCSGIDSMVVGEDEILGQVKSAYAFSKERLELCPEAHMIFQAAAAAAKRIKTQTEISKTSVSTATLAAKEAARFYGGEEISVTLIGASGKIGGSLLKNLISYKNVRVYVTERKHGADFGIAAGDPRMKVVPYDERYEYAAKSGCIISATSGPHFTITADRLGEVCGDGRKRLLIDLAVPRDIDPEAAKIRGAELITIDHFAKLAAENNELKRGSVERSKEMIAQDMDELKKQLAMHNLMPQFREIAPKLKAAGAEEFFYRLRSRLTSEAFAQVIETVKTYQED